MQQSCPRQRAAVRGKVRGIMKQQTQRISGSQDSRVTAFIAITLLITACAPQRALLNSERIAERFGSYVVRLLQQDESRRVSNLASRLDDRLITRTLAITYFEKPHAEFAEVAASIRGGASIGSSFQDAGWEVSKQTRHIGNYSVASGETTVAQLMEISLPRDLAMHVYRFSVTQGEQSLPFATIVELHHPDYMTASDLRRIYRSNFVAADAVVAEWRSAVAAALLDLSATPTP